MGARGLFGRNSGAFYFGAALPWDWASPQNDALWRDAVKTLFDPCPSGWRVPRSGEERLSLWNAFTHGNSPWNGLSTDVFGGRTFQMPAVSGGTAWYPATGFRDYGRPSFNARLTAIGSYGNVHSSTVYGTHSVHMDFNSVRLSPVYNEPRAYGFSVRCIRE